MFAAEEDGAAAALTSVLRVHRRNKNPRALGVRVGGTAAVLIFVIFAIATGLTTRRKGGGASSSEEERKNRVCAGENVAALKVGFTKESAKLVGGSIDQDAILTPLRGPTKNEDVRMAGSITLKRHAR